MTTTSEPWRTPVYAHTEEAPVDGLAISQPGERPLLHMLFRESDMERVHRGLVCSSCLTPFPEPPSLRSVKRFREIAHLWAAARTTDEVLRLVALGRCPGCASEVRDEMTALVDRGVTQGVE